MNNREKNESTKSLRKIRTKKGIRCLVVTAVLVVIIYVLHESDIVRGGAISGLLGLGIIVFFLAGLIYLIAGSIGKR